MKIEIVGNGVFGTFLKEFLIPHVRIEPGADNVILAVPLDAYDEVASRHKGKHLINVCSVQRDSNTICLRHSDMVTGIHPLFGPRSADKEKVAVVTVSCAKTELITRLFKVAGVEIYSALPDGRVIDGALHDRMMAVTHLAGMRIAGELKNMVKAAEWIPEKLVPPSFQRIRDFVNQCRDFSPGTAQSIKANPFSADGNDL